MRDKLVAKTRALLAGLVQDIEAFRRAFFAMLVLISVTAAGMVAWGDQSAFHLPARFPSMHAILLGWVLLHMPLLAASRWPGAAQTAYTVYAYAAFGILTLLFSSLDATLFHQQAYQLPQNYSLLFVAFLLLKRNNFLVFSTVICGAQLIWTLANYDLLQPPNASGTSALLIHISGQWVLGAIAASLLDYCLRQLLTSKAALDRQNERLKEEVAEQAELIRRQQQQVHDLERVGTIGQLTAAIAHDFNNLLTAINGYSELAAREVPPDHPLQRTLRAIREAARSSTALVREVLRAGQGAPAQARIYGIDEAVSGALDLLRCVAGRGITLQTRLEGEGAEVLGDPARLEQVLMNLVANARDALPCGGAVELHTRRVTFSSARELAGLRVQPGHYVLLSVSDNGTGMTPEVRRRLFDPFFTTKEAGRGTGLGLLIVHRIVKDMRGGIEVVSEPGRGSTFKIYLSVAQAVPPRLGPVSAPPPGRLGPTTVLVVDDDAGVRSMVAEFLRRNGFQVLEAADAASARSAFDAHPGHLHLLCSDLGLPDQSGFDLAQELLARSPNTKVVFITGQTAPRLPARELSHIPCLHKPLDPETLLAVLAREMRSA